MISRRTLVGSALVACFSTAQLRAEEPTPPASDPPPPTATPTPSPSPSPPPPPSPSPSDSDSGSRPAWKLCIGFGAGAVAALLTGAVLGGVARAREGEQRGDASNPGLYTAELAARGQAGDAMAKAGYAVLAVGGALAVVDVALWVERLRKAPRKKSQAQAAIGVRF